MANIDHQTLRRRSFDLHIAALLQLRREHGHRSFFDDRGYVRGYAMAYLQGWLASEWPEDLAAGIPNLHMNDVDEVTLDMLEQTTQPASIQMAAAHFFRDILHTLESEEVALYDEDESADAYKSQMDELTAIFTVTDNPYWDRSADDDNLVYLR